MNNTYGIPRIGLLPYSREDGSQYFPQGYIDAIEMTGAEVVPVMHDTPLDTDVYKRQPLAHCAQYARRHAFL